MPAANNDEGNEREQDSYAGSRGLYGLRVAKAMVQNQRRWLADEDRGKLADAWPKFNAIQKIGAKKHSQEKVHAQALKKDLSKDRGMTR